MYFDKFPILNYPIKDGDSLKFVYARNILRRIVLSSDLKSSDAAFIEYSVKDGERPEHIAEKLYGDPNYHWLVLLTNNTIDPHHGWYKSDNTMQEYLQKKYTGYDVYFTDSNDQLLQSSQIGEGATLVQGSLSAPILSYDSNMCRVRVPVSGFSETFPTSIPREAQVVEGTLVGLPTARINFAYNPIGLATVVGLNGENIPIKIHRVESSLSSVRYFGTLPPTGEEETGSTVYDPFGQEAVTLIGSYDSGSIGLTQDGAGLRAVDVAGGFTNTWVLLNNGELRRWGKDFWGVPFMSYLTFNYPQNMKPVRAVVVGTGALAAGVVHQDDTITVWGGDLDPTFPRIGVVDYPQGLTGVDQLVLSIYAGFAILKNGRGITAWGSSNYAVPYGLLSIPSEAQDAVQLSSNFDHAMALKPNGTVVCWGRNTGGQCNVPTGLVAQKVASSIRVSWALRTDGTVVSWGADLYNTGLISYPPAVTELNNNVIDLVADRTAVYMLRSDGKFVYWGGVQGVTPHVPTVIELGDASKISKLSAGGNHCVVLFTDGSVRCFGFNWAGEMNENLTGKVDLPETYIGRYMGITDYPNNEYAVTNRQYEFDRNDRRRTIKLLHPRLKDRAIQELESLLRV
jgi:hypothetical protein